MYIYVPTYIYIYTLAIFIHEISFEKTSLATWDSNCADISQQPCYPLDIMSSLKKIMSSG